MQSNSPVECDQTSVMFTGEYMYNVIECNVMFTSEHADPVSSEVGLAHDGAEDPPLQQIGDDHHEHIQQEDPVGDGQVQDVEVGHGLHAGVSEDNEPCQPVPGQPGDADEKVQDGGSDRFHADHPGGDRLHDGVVGGTVAVVQLFHRERSRLEEVLVHRIGEVVDDSEKVEYVGHRAD